METTEPSSISPLLGTEVHRPRDLLDVSLDVREKRACLRRWMREVAPSLLVPAPLVALNAWSVLLESVDTYAKLYRREHRSSVSC